MDNTLLTDKGDTLLSCGHLSLEVAVWPLLLKRSPCGVSNWQNSRRITEIPRQAWT
ncbi:MAG: hypothetical protein ACLRMJ_00030 [Alistipes finegoldii]